ncbi:hypothetical protein Phum_PHUM183130 [Pediculus humanus corporis]|uniref:Uncharacterized protein n=1 Tax=Pediculus humanus subsp. corporis TaxID=121224 RepID=E0VGH8_PEDHC|nr:uncharacterized protein Phum_PHUM183130 [Pediculus humanus corporis]EEB12484.1 hypothetical protein Phum_PHUM183130 [Pediculus humanus corporis]
MSKVSQNIKNHNLGNEASHEFATTINSKINPACGIWVQEVDYGQPCEICREKCDGFVPHDWR